MFVQLPPCDAAPPTNTLRLHVYSALPRASVRLLFSSVISIFATHILMPLIVARCVESVHQAMLRTRACLGPCLDDWKLGSWLERARASTPEHMNAMYPYGANRLGPLYD